MIDAYLFAPSGPEFLGLFLKWIAAVAAVAWGVRFAWALDPSPGPGEGQAAGWALEDPA